MQKSSLRMVRTNSRELLRCGLKALAHDKKAMWPIALFFVFLVSFLAFNPASARAQLYTGSLTGIVADPSGAVIPGAHVTAIDVRKGFHYTVTTNVAGRYLLRPLPPSTYNLTVEASGFKTFAQHGIILAVNQSGSINVTLEVGSPTQTCVEAITEAGWGNSPGRSFAMRRRPTTFQ